MSYSEKCPQCGRNNDPGEICECNSRTENTAPQNVVYQEGGVQIRMINGKAYARFIKRWAV